MVFKKNKTAYEAVREHEKKLFSLGLAMFQAQAIRYILIFACVIGEAVLTFVPMSEILSKTAPELVLVATLLGSVSFVIGPSAVAYILSKKNNLDQIDKVIVTFIIGILLIFFIILAVLQITSSNNTANGIVIGIDSTSVQSSYDFKKIFAALFLSTLRVGVSLVAFVLEYYRGIPRRAAYLDTILKVTAREVIDKYDAEEEASTYQYDPNSPRKTYTKRTYIEEINHSVAVQNLLHAQSRAHLMEKVHNPEQISIISADKPKK